ncbi:MAG TPA: glycosyltransferase, partial [Roseomonas sp.]|nr:glycosyltransferase [Roseomonas sp.]
EPFTARPPRPPGALRIGSFGYPAASKGTDRIIAAFRLLRQRHPDAMLVLAGYHAGRYVQAEGLADEPGLELHDNPPEATLLALMSSVDVAVQLRMQNTGESSGIVPQLLARDVPTITSAIGAFAEYGEAVVALPGPRIDADLCATILAEAEDPLRRQAARRHYVETHGPVDFCRDLLRSDIAGR